MKEIQIVVLTPTLFFDPRIAVAACRAGAIGVFNGVGIEWTQELLPHLIRLEQDAKGWYGIRLDADFRDVENLLRLGLARLKWLWLADSTLGKLMPDLVLKAHAAGVSVAVEAVCLGEALAAQEAGADAVVMKGHEAGGRIGCESLFVLLQQCAQSLQVPYWVYGGLGLHSSAAAMVAGAAGLVLDSQVLLARESLIPSALKRRLAALDGSETYVVGEEFSEGCRVYCLPGTEASKDVAAQEELALTGRGPSWRDLLQKVRWHSVDPLLMIGQEVGFAADLARHFTTVGAIVTGYREAIKSHLGAVAQRTEGLQGGDLCRLHGTQYAIVQGPMARVSDEPLFLRAVADAGALPFLAASWMRGPELQEVVRRTMDVMQSRPWGVGLLGFLPREIYDEQLSIILASRPPFALIAGGRVEQVRFLESQGIRTYVHAPSRALLDLFLEEGLERFVVEGRESGGHVGPLTSFVLFDHAVNCLTAKAPHLGSQELTLLLAGGIHDGLSAAMAAAIAAPLWECGVNVGFQMGSAYLFCAEAVATGAIASTYQEEILRAKTTVLIRTGPGQAERVIPTPFVERFQQEKKALLSQGIPSEKLRQTLELLSRGRLRIATKGKKRANGPESSRLISLSGKEQYEEGLYLMGQVVSLHHTTMSMASLHAQVDQGCRETIQKVFQIEAVAHKDSSSRPANIAIIGMAAIMPQACDLQRFWENVLNGVCSIREVPPGRWEWKKYFDPDPSCPDKIYSKWGAFLDPVPFDPMEYGIPPQSLRAVEPLQLLALEAARRSLEDAGYHKGRQFSRERTAVVLGISGTGDVGHLYAFRTLLPLFFGEKSKKITTFLEPHLPSWTEDSFPGILMNVAAGRIANRLDLGGLNCTVDAACASALAALYVGMRELEAGHSDMVLVGAADGMQDPFAFMCFAKSRALSPKGQSRPLDAEADGICLGEGVAMLVLKRLEDAERDGDRIYAVIKGIGAGSDGRDRSLTAPSKAGQVRVLKEAYKTSGISPATVTLIEAHATGTTLGDRTEIEAMTEVFTQGQAEPQSCAIGSVKSNIGHTKSTAGLASVIKVALALHHQVLTGTLGVTRPNAALEAPGGPFYVNTVTRPWFVTPGQTRRAGVSAFGFGGTNFHVVLEEYADALVQNHKRALRHHWPCELLVWHAADAGNLLKKLEHFLNILRSAAPSDLGLNEIAYWCAHEAAKGGKETFSGARLAIVARSFADLEKKVEQAMRELAPGVENIEDPDGLYYTEKPLYRDGSLVFLFPGQGSQYVGMLAEMTMAFSEVAAAFEEANRILMPCLGRPLTDFVYPRPVFNDEEAEAQKKALMETWIAQPALGAASWGLLSFLGSLRIKPDLAAGHSYGELVALCASGVFSSEQLMHISYTRGQILHQASKGLSGAMAAVCADLQKVERLLSGISEVWVANVNSPSQVVVAGTEEGIRRLERVAAEYGHAMRRLSLNYAFHSPLMRQACEPLLTLLKLMDLKKPSFPVFSNTTGEPHKTYPVNIAELLSRHVVERVDFVKEIEALFQEGGRIFVEVGPHKVLTSLVSSVLSGKPHVAVALDNKDRPGLDPLLSGLGQVFIQGVPMDLERLFQNRCELRETLQEIVCSRQVSSSTWALTGHRAQPWHEMPSLDDESLIPPVFPLEGAPAEPKPFETQDLAFVGPPFPDASAPKSDLKAMPLSEMEAFTDLDAVMVRYQRMMQRFIEAQKKVMRAYLERSTPARSAGNERAKDWPNTCAPNPFLDGGDAKRATSVPNQALDSAVDPAFQAKDFLMKRPKESNAKDQRQKGLPSSQPIVLSREVLQDTLLRIVADRTGYSEEMLGLDLNLEADLGIDSIKKTEIVGIFFKELERRHGVRLRVADSVVTTLRTLNAIVQEAQAAAERAVEKTGETIPSEDQQARRCSPMPSVPRFMTVVEEAPDLPDLPKGLYCRSVLVVSGSPELADALRLEMEQRGCTVNYMLWNDLPLAPDGSLLGSDETACGDFSVPFRQFEKPYDGVIFLPPSYAAAQLEEMEESQWKEMWAKHLSPIFHMVKAMEKTLRGLPHRKGFLLALVGLGGRFGRSEGLPGSAESALYGAVCGFMKTVAEEWPEVRVKVMDVHPNDPKAVDHVLAELAIDDGLVEVGYRDGKRWQPVVRHAPLIERRPYSLRVDGSWVVLLTGGARGITAEVAHWFARSFHSTLVLVGRTSPKVPDALKKVADVPLSHLRQKIVELWREEGRTFTIREVEGAYANLVKIRKIHETMEKLRSAGARVFYFDVDVRNEKEFGRLLDWIYDELGRLDAVVHGAGIIEDKLLRDKTWESFSRVFGTKADSLQILIKKLRFRNLKLLAFFSSVAGCFGNVGQCDYTAANDLLNKLAWQLYDCWPTRVVAFDWGPWESSGMVHEGARQQFLARGIQPMTPAEGVRSFASECLAGSHEDAQVIWGSGPWTCKASCSPKKDKSSTVPTCVPVPRGFISSENEVRLEVAYHPEIQGILADHCLDGRPVVPMAMAVQTMAEAVAFQNPDWKVVGLHDVSVLKGIVIHDEPFKVSVRLHEIAGEPTEQTAFCSNRRIFHVRLCSLGEPFQVHYEAKIVLAATYALPENQPAVKTSRFHPFPLTAEECYRRWLFHGPQFQCIKAYWGYDTSGIVAELRPDIDGSGGAVVPGAAFVLDPVVLDAAPQVAIAWSRANWDITVLPCGFAALHLYAPLKREPLTMQMLITEKQELMSLRADVIFWNHRHEMVARVHGLECAGNATLNRLARSQSENTFCRSSASRGA